MGRPRKASYLLDNPSACGVGYAAIMWEPGTRTYRMNIQITPRNGYMAYSKTMEEATDGFNSVVRPPNTPRWVPWPKYCTTHFEEVQEAEFQEQEEERERKHRAQMDRRRARRAELKAGK